MPILAAPYQPPAPPAQVDWSGINAMTWTGWDGSVWDLTGRSGGVSLQAGARGHGKPKADRFTSVSPALPGSTYRGHRVLEREVFWPLRLFSDAGSQAWMDYDRAFWNTMRRDRLGAWDVVQPNGQSRRLWLRFEDDGDPAPDTLPSLIGWARYGITLVAEQPFWEGQVVGQPFTTAEPVDFFDADGSPDFHISSGSQVSTATITNPGDTDAYPIYTIESGITDPDTGVVTGSIASAGAGYNGNNVTFGAIASGQKRIVDTRPDRLTVVNQSGADRWVDLDPGSQFDAPIPPGVQPLSLSIVGQGTITVSLQPLYERAW